MSSTTQKGVWMLSDGMLQVQKKKIITIPVAQAASVSVVAICQGGESRAGQYRVGR